MIDIHGAMRTMAFGTAPWVGSCLLDESKKQTLYYYSQLHLFSACVNQAFASAIT